VVCNCILGIREESTFCGFSLIFLVVRGVQLHFGCERKKPDPRIFADFCCGPWCAIAFWVSAKKSRICGFSSIFLVVCGVQLHFGCERKKPVFADLGGFVLWSVVCNCILGVSEKSRICGFSRIFLVVVGVQLHFGCERKKAGFADFQGFFLWYVIWSAFCKKTGESLGALVMFPVPYVSCMVCSLGPYRIKICCEFSTKQRIICWWKLNAVFIIFFRSVVGWYDHHQKVTMDVSFMQSITQSVWISSDLRTSCMHGFDFAAHHSSACTDQQIRDSCHKARASCASTRKTIW